MSKTDKEKALTTGLTFFVIAILVGSVVYQNTPSDDAAPALSTELHADVTGIAEVPELDPVLEVIEAAQTEEIRAVSEPVGIPSFAESFADARNRLGPGQTFFWNGNEYSTNKAEDLDPIQPDDEAETDASGFAADETSGEILTHAETP